MIRRILVPTDGSEFSKNAIEFACDLAHHYNAPIYLLHVMKKAEIPKGLMDFMKAEKIDDHPENVFLQKIGDEITRMAEDQIKKIGKVDFKTFVVGGDPAEEIIQFAKSAGIDMIVMGRRGISSIESIFLGSVSQKVCHAAPCICVTVK